MESLKRILSKCGFILFFLIVALICCMKKDSHLQTTIVSYPNSQIVLSTDSILEQTWQPHVKKISGLKVPYTTRASFECKVKLEIMTDDRSEVLVSEIVEKQFGENECGDIKFTFKTTRLILGERYRIQISFEKEGDIATIFVDSGSNYMGASVDGKECNEAVALKIDFIKNSRVFWLFAVMFPLVSFSFLFMVLWDRSWEEVVALSFIFSIFIMYVFGLIEKLTLGISFMYILAILSFFTAVYLYIKKDKVIKDLISPGVILWGIMVFVIMVSCQGIWLARWDEYTHWGLAVKDMFYYDSFAKHYNTTVMASRYVPFTTLAEYLYVYINEVFGEDIIYVAFQIMLLNGIIIISYIAKKEWKYIFPIMAIMFLVPIMFFPDITSCIYVDPVLAIFAIYILVCYFGEDTSLFNWLRMFAGLFALVTIKDMGLVIAGIIILIIIADILFQQWRNRKFCVRQLLVPFMGIMSVISFFMSWQIYLSIPNKLTETQIYTHATDTIEASGITVDGIKKFITLKGESYQYNSVKNYIVKLFDGEAYQIGSIGFSCMDIATIVLILAVVLGYLGVWGKWKYKMISFGCFSFVGCLVYCGILGLLYIFAFPKEEALTSASYERYVASFLCAVVIVFMYILLRSLAENINDNKKCYCMAIFLTAAIIITMPFENVIFTNRERSISKDMKYGFSEMEEALRSFSKRGETIYFVCSNSGGGSYFMFRNSASPLHVPNYGYVNLVASEESIYMQEEIYAVKNISVREKTILTVEQWKQKLRACDYVFIMIADEMFKKDYAELFENASTISSGTFYKVLEEGEDIILKSIGQVPVGGYF